MAAKPFPTGSSYYKCFVLLIDSNMWPTVHVEFAHVAERHEVYQKLVLEDWPARYMRTLLKGCMSVLESGLPNIHVAERKGGSLATNLRSDFTRIFVEVPQGQSGAILLRLRRA
jgi:hypothetical protein